MKDLNLIELYRMKKRLLNENIDDTDFLNDILEAIEYKENLILEDTSATGGPVSSGDVSAQPSGLAGATIGTNWASGGGTEGGYLSTPYNPSGSNRMQQKIPIMGKDHGARTGKKSRVKKLDIKALKDALAKRKDFTAGQGEREPGKKKVMDFNDFMKNDYTTIKK